MLLSSFSLSYIEMISKKEIKEHCNKKWKQPESLSERILEDIHIEDIEYIRKLYKEIEIDRIVISILIILVLVVSCFSL